MRPLEIAISVSVLPYILYLLSPSRGGSSWFSLFPILGLLLAVCHWTVEGPRWQMAPAYVAVLLLAAYGISGWLPTSRGSFFVGAAALLLELIAIGGSILMPVFKLPAPTGPYKVGTQVRHLVDESRRDAYSGYPNNARELVIQIWYPVDSSVQGTIVPYRDKRISTFADAHYALVETHSLSGVPMSRVSERYPVVMFTPSWSGIRTESTFQIEQLASNGYVVVGIDHPYSSRITVFPDGRIARRRFVGDEDYASQSGFEMFLKAADEQVALRAYDAKFVLDTLEHLNAKDPKGLLTERLAVGQVGIFGYSLGGGTALQACWLDPRFKAGLDMDGMIAGDSGKEGPAVPLFFMLGDDAVLKRDNLSRFNPAERRKDQFNLAQISQMKQFLWQHGGYWMVIPDMTHGDFSDAPFYSTTRGRPVSQERLARIISQYMIAFFDKHLKGINSPLLDKSPTETPEFYFEAWRTTAANARHE